ncbi:DYH6 protein, partial [Amia calva]|nr:DYH6 protein [Amia calva]
MPFLERQYDVLMQMHTIAMDYSIPIAPEELALYQTLVTSFQHLKFTLVFCETRRDDNILRFSVDLGNRLNQLQYDLVHVKTKVKNPVLFSSETIPKVAKEIIQSLTEEVAILSRRAHSYACYRDLLGHSVSAKKSLLAPVERRQANDASTAAVQAELSDIDRDLSLRNLLWEMQDEWEKLYSQWKDTTFDHLNVDGLQKDVNRFTQTIYMLEKGLPENDIVPHLKQRVMDFKLCLPIIVALRNPYLCPRHWEDIEYKLGRSFIKEKNFTLGNLLDLKVFQYKSVIADISSTATNEATLEAILNKVIDLWKSTDFQLVDHQTDTSVVRIIASAAEIMTQLEESQATMATIRSSRYAEPIKHQIEGWGRKLNHFSHTLEEWMMCQKRWLFLEPIFSAGDIQRQLPAEAKLFSQVDKTWKEIMQKTEENPNALKIATAPGVLEILQASNGHLETIQKCLEDYLEMKRMVFPRFYFLSNEDLLDILSQSKDANSIQLHLAKCFDNIRSLDIQEQAKVHPVVASLRSAEFETIHLLKTVQVRGPVEQWLGNMETAMFNTMKRHLKLGMMDWNPLEFKKWVLSHPGQVVLTVTQIMFYKECGHSFSGTDQNVILNGVFQDLVHHLEELADLTSEPLPPHQQATVGALLTILVHCRDVLTHLFQQKVCKADDFEWTRQLHYEWNEHNSMCYVVQANASFMYGYEYLGCSHRLVITPLTDRCWLTLTGALSLHLGGAPSGPAGTGKTETVKDLAKALGKFCVVFNCSEGLDYKMMGKLFSGMVQSGAWCCFDEFNRIDVEVLSVIASQLQAIKVAKDTQTMRFVFEGRDIRLNASCGVFITMNPSYKGRVDLPDNLKSLFRPVAMMVPDYGLIAEIMLFSEGFKSAKSLSRKIVNLYQLVSTQLSQQDHYDFGMRAIKSVLVMAGQKRRFTALKLSLTEEEESCILIDALLDANLPKLVPEDVSLFKSIMWDLFPAIGIPTSASPRLQKAITTATEILGLQQWPSQAEKVIQLYKQILARHGVMLVGPTGGGKTAVRSILQHALPLLSSVSRKETSSVQVNCWIESITINPKCITLGELYGQVDPHTLEWSDGLLASTIRAFSKELNQQADAEKRYNIKTDSWRWIIMDGPVDTLWVENLNSVLDDTKTLCLANGERIILPAGMRLIFEVDTLSQASPATISRCAMVYMDPVDLGWMPYIKSWLSRQPKELGEAGQSCLQSLFDRSMSEGLCFVKKNQKMQNFPVPEVAIVTTLCSILAAEDYKWFLQKNPGKLTTLLGKLFVFAFTWAVGGVLNHFDDYEDNMCCNIAHDFQTLVQDVFEGNPPHGVQLPCGNRMIFSYFVDLQRGAFVPWEELVPSTETLIHKGKANPGENVEPSNNLIVTVDTVRFSFLTSLLVLSNQPVLLTDAVLRSPSLDPLNRTHSVNSTSGRIMASIFQCTARTSSAQIQAHILQKLVKKRKDNLGAPKDKRVLVFVDDVNMPVPDEYGAQPPLELIRQFLELQGVFDTKNLTWRNIEDVTLFAACAPPGGGRHDISTRLLRHFSVIALPHPSVQSLQHIFQVQLGRFLGSRDFVAEVQKCRAPLVSASIAVYQEMCQSLLPTPTKYHYTFNLRDLSKVIQGLQQAHESELISREAAAQLFVHEATRVFHDRLVNDQDRELFHRVLSRELHNYFKVSWPVENLMKEPIIFGDFVDMNVPATRRIYKQIADQRKLQTVLEEYHIRSSSGNSQFPMVFFKEAVQHITRAARVFRQPGGHMMLLGLDGTGKVTCASLACYISGCHLYRLAVSRSYSHPDFREDLKKVFKQTGLHRQNTVLLITDSDIVEDSFLEDINCIVNSGEVPGLFDNEEIDGIAVQLNTVAEGSVNDSREELYAFFLKQVRQRLHIAVASSPAGATLRQYCRVHPALLNCCTIDWYSEWTRDALLRVAEIYIHSMDLRDKHKGLQDGVAQVCVDVHHSVSLAVAQYWEEMRRHYYVTPSSFLEFIDTFSRMSQTEKTKIHNIRDRFNNGLSTLSEAAALVRVMQDELVALGPKIEEKSQDIEVLMDKLKKDSEAVEQVRAIVKMEEDIMKEETRIVREYAEQATADLNAVMPMVEKAVSALDALEKSDISEIRVYTSPPDLVLTVMHAVCILLQQKPDWSTAKRLLGDPGFLKRLVSLDKDSLPEKVFLKLRRYSQNPDFTPEKVGLVSVACQSMCLWVLALEHYHEVHKMIEPKQKKVEVAQEALARAQWKLKEKQKSLTKIEEHRLTLQQRYNASVAGKKELAERRELTTQRLQRASVLISALADEKGRWEKSVSDLESKLQGIVGDVMISAACVTYFGGFTAGYRRTLLHTWLGFCNTMGVPVSPAYTLTTAVMEKNQVRHWQNEGLPPDQTSTENAIIVKSAHCWPLLIDPQGQANNWICCMEGKKLHKVFASDPNYMRTVETAIRLGEPVLIQDVGEGLDPALRPVLVKNISSRGGQDLIKIGDTQIEYNHNFRLYLTTWLPNPHFLPAVCNLVKLINFSVTSEGLQEQLLSSVVSLQHPQLEQQHFQLLHSVTADLFLLRQLESRSLLLLQSTEGHILDDQDLIDNLRKSRVTSKEILNRIQVSEATEREIDKVRKKYLPVAQRGTLLYFVLADLVQINYMYQFSLEWFNEVFVKAIQDATCGQECPLLDCSEPEVSLALFADHQLCFSFMVCAGIMRANHNDSMLVESLELLPENEWKIFLHSSVLACTMDVKKVEHRDGVSVEDCPCSPWLSHSIWKQCQYLSTHLTAFSMLCTSLQNNKPQWTSFFKAKNLYHFMCKPYINNTTSQPTEEERQPLCITVFKWEGLSAFQKLILIKILKAECLNAAVKDFVVEKIGSKYLESGKITMRKVYEKSTANSPLIFLLSPGMDPASQLLRLSQEVSGGALHLDMVSLGQGQGLRAEELISRAQVRQGHWVFLQNCHLAASFMPRLQSLVSSLRQKGSDVDPQFRLWLSSKPDPTFPAFILQKGIKIAVEPPQGIKNKLLHMFSGGTGQVTESTFAKPGCGPAWKTLLFSLCLFHAAVLERKKYGPQGWNIPYTFMSSDLEVAMLNLEILLVGSEVPWPALRFLTGEIVYGGRVTDPWDRRCLLSILNSFYSPSVLQHSHAYSADGVYRAISAESSLSDCRSYIESLPDRDAPVVLGMDLSAESVLLQGQAQQLLHTIVSMQPRLGHSEVTARDGQSQDEVVLAMAADILKTLPETVETEEAADRSPSLRTLITGHATADQGSDSLAHSALLVILCQEIDRFDHMLRVMHTSLHSFCRAVRGEVLMTEGLEEVYSSLLTMKVPTMWKKCSYESCKPLGSWIEDLVQRVRFFNAWAEQVKTSLLQRAQPRSFWLSAFFFPQGFLTAVLQNFARRRGVSVDALVFSHRVQPTGQNLKDWSNTAHKTFAFEGSEAPADGVLVFGLYLDGARWDPLSQTLADSLPHQQHCSVPEIHFLPCQISDEKAEADGKPAGGLMHYECPLYPTPHRASAPSSPGLSSHFITALALPTTAPPDRWVIRGTALVCQLNE